MPGIPDLPFACSPASLLPSHSLPALPETNRWPGVLCGVLWSPWAAWAHASKLPANDAVAKRLQAASAQVDDIRKKIVATKEGGMITGEERIRELLGQLYGAVTAYDGKPTDYQSARTESLGHELQDVIDDFQKLVQKEVTIVNAGLKKKKMETISVLVEAEWQKKKAAESSAVAGAGMRTQARGGERD